MTCCQCQGIDSVFDQAVADRELKDYRRKGPAKTTRLLLDALAADGVTGLSLLDIGGGVGAIQHALLNAGAAQAVGVDASRAYLAAARSEAERQGLADRVTFRQGDFVDLAPDTPPADIVTLDRVLCCYHDVESLVELSAARARKLYGLVFPRDTWWMKVARPILNSVFWVQRNPFRIFIHPTATVEALLRREGLERRFYRRSGIWQVMVYARPGRNGGSEPGNDQAN